MGKVFNQIKTNFTIVPNLFITEKKLTAMARMVFIYMLSKPEGWEFNRELVCSDLIVSKDTLKKYLIELEELGWITRLGQQNENGKFGGVEYVLNNILTDEDVVIVETGSKLYQYNATKGAEKKEKVDDWSTNFDIYIVAVEDAVNTLIADSKHREIYTNWFPNIDYEKTIDKTAFFWRSETGWKYKKRKRSSSIDMVATIKNGMDKNRVYKPFGEQKLDATLSHMDNQLDLFYKARNTK